MASPLSSPSRLLASLPSEGQSRRHWEGKPKLGPSICLPTCPWADSPCQASRCPWIPGLISHFLLKIQVMFFSALPSTHSTPNYTYTCLSLRSRIRERRSYSEKNASSKKAIHLANRKANETWNRASMCHRPRIFVPLSPTRVALPTSAWGRPWPWCEPVHDSEVFVTCMHAAWFLLRTTCVCACSRVCGGQHARPTARRVRCDRRRAAACSSLAGEGGL